ncbi:MAG: FAD-dependent oxidoreductase [Phycisphaeraceae bacterium]|nr:FAD-dependent oxidoreductase [Phycisphaeraceae bacterium]
MKQSQTDVLIVGGGVGGVAAALAAAAMGRRVIITEPTNWLGGQLTAQAVPPDEHRWIESFGCTRRYRQFRNAVRRYYRQHYPLTAEARGNPHLNPGDGFVSRLCHEPRVGLAIIEQMLAPHRSSGRLAVLPRHEPIAADAVGDRVRSVTLRDLNSGNELTISAPYILDATELGDLLPLAGVEYVSGAESRRDTGELHALDGPANPEDVQSLTWCFAMGYDPHGEHVIDKPAQYEFWRDYQPKLTPQWPMKLLGWTHQLPQTLETAHRVLMSDEGTQEQNRQALWLFRRILAAHHYQQPRPDEVTIVNWHMNDYWQANIIDAPPEQVACHLEAARQLSLSVLYWLQTEAPRPDGGVGYPGLCMRGDITGTSDGLAKAPYIRESRRIKALFTVTENHVGTEARCGRNYISSEHMVYHGKEQGSFAGVTAETFHDSVGIGAYRIDLHPSTAGRNYIDISSLPFQIPLGALIPCRVRNLLAACKNIGTTHITNGCYRLHPVEWNIGEAAGALAAYCLEHDLEPNAVREKSDHLSDFQNMLARQGVELAWPVLSPL